MKNSALIVRFALVFAAMFALASAGTVWWLHTHRIQLVLINETGQRLTAVDVHYTGGSFSLIELPSGATQKTWINPAGKSGLDLRFIDAQGMTHTPPVDAYFDGGYPGTVTLKLKPDFSTAMTE